jgi:hypothetical protein
VGIHRTHSQQGDPLSLLLFFQNKGRRLMKERKDGRRVEGKGYYIVFSVP